MSTAKKFELASDEVYLQEALKDGRATIMEVSMKALGTPDVAFQARVKHLDMDHVHRLSLIHDAEGRLSPVVIFRATAGRKQRMILADGFHRHEVYLKKKLPAIRAYVVDVAMDRVEHEARLFSAMCNQNLSLGRTKEDIRKAVELLFVDRDCWQWTDTRIAKHCGSNRGSVTNWRLAYKERTGTELPETVMNASGDQCRYTSEARSSGSGRIPQLVVTEEISGGGGSRRKRYRTCVNNKVINLGYDEEKAKERLKTIKDEVANRSVDIHTVYSLFLSNRLNFVRINKLGIKFVRGFIGHGIAVTPCGFTAEESVPWAVGCLMMLREMADVPVARLVVLCYQENGPQASIDVARKLGIEFLTPDELIESLKTEAG
jgi:hypothetical protein